MKTIIIIAVSIIVGLVIKGCLRYKENQDDDEELQDNFSNKEIYNIEEVYYIDGTTADDMFDKLNKFRSDEGLRPVVIDKFTTEIAIKRCKEMIADGFISHAGFGDDMLILIELGADTVGENIAYGYSTVEGVMKAFWKSTSHRKNMLDPENDWCGIGVIKETTGSPSYYCIILGGDDKI